MAEVRALCSRSPGQSSEQPLRHSSRSASGRRGCHRGGAVAGAHSLRRSARRRSPASRPAPATSIDVKAYWNGTPRKYRPGTDGRRRAPRSASRRRRRSAPRRTSSRAGSRWPRSRSSRRAPCRRRASAGRPSRRRSSRRGARRRPGPGPRRRTAQQRAAALAHLRAHPPAHRRSHREHVSEHELDDRPAEHGPLRIGDPDRHLAMGLAGQDRPVAGVGGLERDVGARVADSRRRGPGPR